MIKLSINKNGNAHESILMTIEAIPHFIKISDSYYLYDFLELSPENLSLKNDGLLKYGLNQFIHYWIDSIRSIKIGHQKFLPFDLSDEYVAGLLIQKTTTNLLVNAVYSSKIQGWSINKSTIDNEIETNKILFLNEIESTWIMTEAEMIQNLEQSIVNLENNK
jgi:hypothetical protein